MGSLPEMQFGDRRPGIMVVAPRLKEPSPESAAMFERWTRMHFRDMLSMPADKDVGKMTRSLRYTAPADEQKYSFDPSKGKSPYFYTCHMDDIGIVQTPPYYEVPRALDLENTRALGEGEEAVGQAGLVFDIVTAEFAIYEEVESAIPSKVAAGNYQTLALPLTRSPAKSTTPPPTYLIGLTIKTLTDAFSQKGLVPPSVLGLQASLLSALCAAPNAFKPHTSLYHHAGSKAQPAMHPEFAADDGEWLVTVLLVDEEGVAKREDVVDLVDGWGEAVQDGETGVQITWGIWGGDLLMS